MRRRAVKVDSEGDDEGSGKLSLQKALKSFDLFPKVKESATVQTKEGAALSSISFGIMVILFISEFVTYLKISTKEHLVVDRVIGQQISINFNLTLHSLPCSATSVDAMDITGDQQVDVIQEIKKQKLNENGEPIGRASDDSEIDFLEPLKKLRPHLSNSEGCILSGSLLVNKVAGNFHVALGQSQTQGVRHIHYFVLSDIQKYNASHTINHLSFGEHFPGVKYPLDGVTKILTNQGGGVYQYFIKIVPTIYTNSNGQILKTNQFSATDQFQKIDEPQPGQPFMPQLPGIFFVYDISQYMVQITNESQSFSTFLVNVCAIIGGVFTITGVIDSVIYHIKNMRTNSDNRNDLNKV